MQQKRKVLGKTKRQQTSIPIRKSIEQQRVIKKARFSFLGNKERLLFFPIPKTIDLGSPRVPNDCVICSLQFLKIINTSQAVQLRLQLINSMNNAGITINQIIHILTLKLEPKYTHIQFRDIPFIKANLLFEEIPNNNAFVVGLHPKNSYYVGHMIIFFKDSQGVVGLIDPQNEYYCTQTACMTYLNQFNNQVFTVFIGIPK